MLQPLDVRLEEGFAFRLSFQGSGGTAEGEETFSVTPKTGIVYVQDPAAIRRYSHRQFSFTFMWRREGRLPEKSCVIVVAVEDSSGKWNFPPSGCGLMTAFCYSRQVYNIVRTLKRTALFRLKYFVKDTREKRFIVAGA